MNARIGTKSLTRSRWLVASALSVSLLAYGLTVVPSAEGAQSPKRPAKAVHTSTIHRSSSLVPSTVTCTVDNPTTPTTSTCDLYAHMSSSPVTFPGVDAAVPAVSFWSYTTNETDPVGATGPTLVVNQGETVNLVLHNRMGLDPSSNPIQTALSVPQLDNLDADLVGVPNGGDKTYTFVAKRPGTFIYQAGGVPDAARQAGMGMVGALVVLPTGAGANTAYGDSTTAYSDDSVVLLTDVDPDFNNHPYTFDMRGYSPKLHLLNGSPYPATTDIQATAGQNTLLRIVNGGIIQHALGVLGTDSTIVGESARPLGNNSYGAQVEKISAGDTLDMLVSVPSTGGPLYPVYDSSSRLDNSVGPTTGAVPFGGALTFLSTGPITPSTAGPSVTDLTVVGASTVNGSAPLGFTAVGGADPADLAVTGVEYTIDNGALPVGTGTPAAFTARVPNGVNIADAAAIGSLDPGTHTLLVRASGLDPVTSATVWGPWASVAFTVDNVGPTTSLVVDPTSTNLVVDPSVADSGTLTVSGTSSDSTTGGSGVTSAEAFIDGHDVGPLTVTPSGDVTVSVDGIISNATLAGLNLTEGEHSLTAQATDSLGNPGAMSDPVTFIVDTTGPVVSAVYVNPSPNNGSQGSANDPTNVEVRAWFADPGPAAANGKTSGVVDGEAFLGTTARQNGKGFPLFPYTPPGGGATVLVGYIPVSQLTQYSLGQTVPVAVHARDAAGNWGDYKEGSLVLTLDYIFASDFDTIPGLVPPWARFAQTVGGGLTGGNQITTGTNHAFVVTRNPLNADTNGSLSFLLDASPSAETSYNVAFDFTANAAATNGFTAGTTANNARVFSIFQARNAAGRSAYSVEFLSYKPTTAAPAVRGVRLRVRTGRTGNGNSTTSLIPLVGPGPFTIHVAWTSATRANPTLTVGGTTLGLSRIDTSALVVDTALLGVSAVNSPQGTFFPIPTGGTFTFDNFNSARVSKP